MENSENPSPLGTEVKSPLGATGAASVPESGSEASPRVPDAGADTGSDSEFDSDDEGGDLSTLAADGELKGQDKLMSGVEADTMGQNIAKEVVDALYSARYLGTFLAFMGLFAGYQLTIAPYRVSALDRSFSTVTGHDLGLIRPVLTGHEQATIRHKLMHGETSLELPEPFGEEEIKVRFHSGVDKHGSFQPPQLFYDGVIFGLTDDNPHSLRYTAGPNGKATSKGKGNENQVNAALYERRGLLEVRQTMESALGSMRPKPTAIIPRRTHHNDTGWQDEGFAAYYSYADLEAQGKLSSDKLQPWKRVLEDVLNVARDFRQVYVTVWYPHEFGHAGEDLLEQGRVQKDPRRFTTILQQVVPTRTGLKGITSTVPVWLSAVSRSKPRRQLQEKAVVKEWTEDDHWDMYKPGGSKHRHWSAEDLEAMNYELHPGIKVVGAEDSPPHSIKDGYVEGTTDIMGYTKSITD